MFYCVAFDPIGIQTGLTLQNDRQHLIFVTDFIAVGKKMTGNGR